MKNFGVFKGDNTSEVTLFSASKPSVVTLNVCNTNTKEAKISVKINDVFLECLNEIGANGVLERTGVVLSAGDELKVQTSLPNVHFMAYGMEG